MSLREEMQKYEQITGESAEHVPIIKLGAFLDGYEMGLKALEQQQRWIPIKTRPMTEEEKEEMETEYDYMYACELPEDGQDVLVTDWCGNVELDTFCRDYPNGCYFESNCDDDEVKAWMPLPEPYVSDINAGKMAESEDTSGKYREEYMRDATAEEQKSTHDYIKSISKPTGIQFDDVVEEIDFVQEHPRIKTKLRVCEDCVSREKAKQFLYERIDRLNDDELYDIFSRIIDDMYNELPSITPKKKVGKWIKYNIDIAPHPLHCSECGWSNHHLNRTIVSDFKHCPNCGAKMIDEPEMKCGED